MISDNGTTAAGKIRENGQLEPETTEAVAILKRWFLSRWSGLLAVSIAAAVFTAIFTSFQDERRLPDVAMLYLAVTLISAATWGYAVGAFSALLTNLFLNYFFIPPLHVFNVADRGNAGGLVLFFLVAALGASLVSRMRDVARHLQTACEENLTLSELIHAVAASAPGAEPSAFCSSAARRMGAARVELIEHRDGWVVLAGSARAGQYLDERESAAIAQLADRLSSGQRSTLKRIDDRFVVPLPGYTAPAVLVISGMDGALRSEDVDRFLRTVADQATIAIRLGRRAA